VTESIRLGDLSVLMLNMPLPLKSTNPGNVPVAFSKARHQLNEAARPLLFGR